MLGPCFLWEPCWVSDGQCPGMKAKDLFLGFPIPLDMPWPPSALLGVPSCGSWCPGAAEPAREGLGIQGLGEARPARKGTVLICCGADGPWGLSQGQWLGFQQQEQPVSGQQRLFSQWLISGLQRRELALPLHPQMLCSTLG